MPVLGKGQGKAWREDEAVELDGIWRMEDLCQPCQVLSLAKEK